MQSFQFYYLIIRNRKKNWNSFMYLWLLMEIIARYHKCSTL